MFEAVIKEVRDNFVELKEITRILKEVLIVLKSIDTKLDNLSKDKEDYLNNIIKD